MRNGINTNAEYGNVSSWPLDFMGGNRDAELMTGREGSIKGISALCSRRGTTENKVVNVVPDKPHRPPPNDPFESIGDGRKNLGGGAEAERKHCVDVDGILPLNAQEEAVLWVDRDDAIGGFDVHLCDQISGVQSRGQRRDFIHGDVLERAQEWVDAIIHAVTLRQ